VALPGVANPLPASKLHFGIVPRLLLALAVSLTFTTMGNALDLSHAVILRPPDQTYREKKAIEMLVEEVEKRTKIRWQQIPREPRPHSLSILVGTVRQLPVASDAIKNLPAELDSEGYKIFVQAGSEKHDYVCICGADERGVLFGVGRFLRELQMRPGHVTLTDDFATTSAPKIKLRGHQLGFRPKTNTYDAWDLPQWEQYFRDLAVFGCNAIELIPPRSDDDPDSPHFHRPPMEMMIGMSKLADDYGLDVWIWYPALDKDYSDAGTVESAVKEWGEVFSKLPRVDAVFVPGGDPGHTPPKDLMALLKKQTENLHRYHPKAQMWVSPQGFSQEWLDEFLAYLKREQGWLSGLVYGPQVRIDLARLRQAVPKNFSIRLYPDITHSRQCQYSVPDWDVAFAITEGRECINPRPEDETAIFRSTQKDAAGFITYSEGCNDDVNKCIWSSLGWDPDASVRDVLRQFGRYFIEPDCAEEFAEGLFDLERNWRGPLLANTNVQKTLQRFQALEKKADPAVLKNWRFQQALFRAYYDAFIKERLTFETDSEAQAMNALSKSSLVERRLKKSEEILEQAAHAHVRDDLRNRILKLGAELFESIGMQLSVEKYKASAVDRGASLDTLDVPLNNRLWLEHRFAEIRKLVSETEKLAAINEILQWTNAGPRGFYDDLGSPGRQPHLVTGQSFAEDPGRMKSARIGFDEAPVRTESDLGRGIPRRISWMDHAETLYDMPLQMHYEGLDPRARYKVRVVYGGDNFKRRIRLEAGNQEIHPYISKPVSLKPLEFSIPLEATKAGSLTLTWDGEKGLGGNGRGCQISEVWLFKASKNLNEASLGSGIFCCHFVPR